MCRVVGFFGVLGLIFIHLKPQPSCPQTAAMESGLPGGDEEPAQREACPLCALDDVDIEHAGNASAGNPYVRRIMARELVFFGVCDDAVVYRRIAEEYNRFVCAEMHRSGLACKEWTPALVKRHFEHHVQLLPRHILGRDLRRLETASKLLEAEMASRLAQGLSDSGEMIDGKTVTKLCNVAKTKMMLTRDLRACVREDLASTGVAALWRSMDLGASGASEAKKLLDKAALIQSAAGAGDRPSASDLFGV